MRSRVMLARYDGTCPNCDGPIVAQVDRIDYYRRGKTSHVTHEDCAQAKRARDERARKTALKTRYVVAEGPLDRFEGERERVACWDYLTSHGCYGVIIERWGSQLVIGFATFLGYNWHVCAEVAAS